MLRDAVPCIIREGKKAAYSFVIIIIITNSEVIFMMYVCACVCMYACLNAGNSVGPLELELQLVLSHPTWVWGTKLESSGPLQMFYTTEQFLHPLHSMVF